MEHAIGKAPISIDNNGDAVRNASSTAANPCVRVSYLRDSTYDDWATGRCRLKVDHRSKQFFRAAVG
ncbi:hypothetical protein BJD99_00530 [Rhodococcus sp. 1163]|nr:hypothetical protein BJD99_00530 [Rhodococcus sp. 1163]